jgi:hypothetical protein
MDTLQRRLRYVAACGLFGTAVAAALATGCSGDDNGGGGPDAAADTTTDVKMDVGQMETSLQDNSHPDTSTSEAGNDAAGDAQGDAHADADAATTVSDASDAGDGFDGNVGVPACVTTPALLGNTSDAGPAPKVLFAFDDASDAGVDPGFAVYSDSPSTALPLAVNPLDGHPCAGSLTTTITYTAFGQKSQVYYNYTTSNPQDWSGYTVLHFWVKVITTDPSTIGGIEPRLDTGAAYTQHFGNFVNGTTLADGAWHEATLDLPIADAGADSVVGFQLQLETATAGVDGGSALPPPATWLIDSIWVN